MASREGRNPRPADESAPASKPEGSLDEANAQVTGPVDVPVDGPVNGQPRDRKSRIMNRLRRLEGQVRGLQRMVGEERSCQDSLTLLAGIRSALDAAGDLILEEYLENCAPDLAAGGDGVAELVRAVKLARG
jgi:DNA-binding FrmR family transcriptional regulator